MDLDYQYDHSPFDKLLGLRLEEASGDRVVAVLPVTADLYQNNGVVHGGVYGTAVKTTASVGAELWLGADGSAVGLSTDTEVRRAVQTGKLRIEAITDERGRLVAHGRVLLMNLRKTPGEG